MCLNDASLVLLLHAAVGSSSFAAIQQTIKTLSRGEAIQSSYNESDLYIAAS